MSKPETHTKRQATQHGCLPSLLGDGGKGIAIEYGEKGKKNCTGPTRAAKAEQKSLVPARQAQRINQERPHFICILRVPTHLSFNIRVHKEWRLPISGNMMEKSALAGGGGVCTPIPFQPITITYKVAVYAPAEWADTLTLFRIYCTNICALCFQHSQQEPPLSSLSGLIICHGCFKLYSNSRLKRISGFQAVVLFGSWPTPPSPVPSASCLSFLVFLCIAGRA